MTKIEVVEFISQKTGIIKQDVSEVIEAFMYTVKRANTEGQPVTLRDFGTFTPKLQAKKTARNITAGTSIVIPARFIPAFKPAPGYKKQLGKLKVPASATA